MTATGETTVRWRTERRDPYNPARVDTTCYALTFDADGEVLHAWRWNPAHGQRLGDDWTRQRGDKPSWAIDATVEAVRRLHGVTT